MVNEHDFNRAREILLFRVNSKSILSELAEDPASAVPMVMMGLVFGLPTWLILLAAFADGRDPVGSDIFGVATVGFLISLMIASRLGAKEKAKRGEFIHGLPPQALANRFCNEVHSNEYPKLWRRMDRFRREFGTS